MVERLIERKHLPEGRGTKRLAAGWGGGSLIMLVARDRGLAVKMFRNWQINPNYTPNAQSFSESHGSGQ